MFNYVADITPVQPIHDDASWEGTTYSMFRAVHKEGDKYITYVRVCLNGKIGMLCETFDLNWKSNNDKKYFGFDIRAEDPRLVKVGEKLYTVFIGDSPIQGQYKCIWMHEHGSTSMKPVVINRMNIIEKNWAPFEYKGDLMFVYNYDPLIILKCDVNTGHCVEFKGSLPFDTSKTYIRGGSNLQKVGNQYIGFGHSRLPIDTKHRPGFLHLTHKIVLSEDLELVHVSKPIFYNKGGEIVKETIQDPVSFWIEDGKMFITSNMRDNYCEIYEYTPDDEYVDDPGDWNNCVKEMVKKVSNEWYQ